MLTGLLSGITSNVPRVRVSGLHKSLARPRRLREIIRRPFSWEFVEILKGIDLEVGAGEIVGLVGPNGAGKTTLIRVICGLLLPTSGTVTVSGYDVVRKVDEVASRIGYVPATEQCFIGRLTGYQNLEFFARLHGLFGSTLVKRVNGALEKVGLLESSDMRFIDYSSGMKQRLCIALSLLGNPEVLLLDEPTKSLDPVTATQVRCLIGDLAKNQGCSVILSSHNLSEVESLCHRVALIHKGRLAATGRVSEVVELVIRSDCRRLLLTVNGALDTVGSVLDNTCGVLSWNQIESDSEKSIKLEVALEPPTAASDVLRNLFLAGIGIESGTILTPSLEHALAKIVTSHS